MTDPVNSRTVALPQNFSRVAFHVVMEPSGAKIKVLEFYSGIGAYTSELYIGESTSHNLGCCQAGCIAPSCRVKCKEPL